MLGKNTKEREVRREESTPNASVGSSAVGGGMTVHGDCSTDGHIRVEGTVEGNLSANGLELTRSGTIQGDASVPVSDKKGQLFVVAGRITGRVTASIVEIRETGVVLGGIEADDVTIHGQVEGGLNVRRRLAITETAVINGEVRTQRITMQEGGRVNGRILMEKRTGTGGKRESAAA